MSIGMDSVELLFSAEITETESLWIVWRIFEAKLHPLKMKRPPTFSVINHGLVIIHHAPLLTLLLLFFLHLLSFLPSKTYFTLPCMLVLQNWLVLRIWISLYRRFLCTLPLIMVSGCWRSSSSDHVLCWFVILYFSSFLDCSSWWFVLWVLCYVSRLKGYSLLIQRNNNNHNNNGNTVLESFYSIYYFVIIGWLQ